MGMMNANPTVPALLLAALLLPAGVLAGGPLDDAPSEPGCGLLAAGGGSVDSKSCLGCHAESAHGIHPIEVDYAAAEARRFRRSGFRPMAEVVARGVRLVDGKVTCVTCHSGTSRLVARLALPPVGDGVAVAPNPRLRVINASYGGGGNRVAPDPTALCIVCHQMGPRRP
jgi:hypothetical protein